MRSAVAILVLIGGAARADEPRDGIAAQATDESPEPAVAPDATNGLHLDPMLRMTPGVASLAREHEGRTFALGKHARATVEGRWWQLDHDVPVHGWRAAARVTRDLGGAGQLWVGGAVESVDTDLAHATFYDLGAGLVRAHRFSHDVTGWIGLSLGYRHWLGEKPPPGESDATTLTLSIGATFR